MWFDLPSQILHSALNDLEKAVLAGNPRSVGYLPSGRICRAQGRVQMICEVQYFKRGVSGIEHILFGLSSEQRYSEKIAVHRNVCH